MNISLIYIIFISQTTMTINYEKRKNTELFATFASKELTNLSNMQNYIPIYQRFFSLNETNYNSINMNHKWHITNIVENDEDNHNLFKCSLKNGTTNKIKKKSVFFKMAPLLDPFKFLVGKYDLTDKSLFQLPQLDSTHETINAKVLEPNNSAYVDGFFSFLSSTLIHKYNFVHGVDYYGSFLGIKNSFKLNVIDDLDYLCKSDFFIKNKNVLFQVEDYEHLYNDEDDDDKPKQLVHLKIDHTSSNKSMSSVKSIHDDLFDNVFVTDSGSGSGSESESIKEHLTLDDLKESSLDLVDMTNSFEFSKINDAKTATIKSGSTCSSRTSHTSSGSGSGSGSDDETGSENGSESAGLEEGKEGNEGKEEKDGEDEKEGEDGKEEWEDMSDSEDDEDISDFEEERIDATLPEFPVNVICMEYCQNTFDSLIVNEDLSDDEWLSTFMQIIMILITYQKAFSFTHNDLHTNNVMYNTTDVEFIYYCYKKKYYKVPTFGRIFKIIDFGRGIYKYDGKIFCSDSFQNGADAATQYNTEPYFNDKKPRLEPNYSFDLCRLACSIFDYVIDDIDDMADIIKEDPIAKLVMEWCLDDNGSNILYKNTGVERYPDFKLYKMIARCVHNHTPQNQLNRPEFVSFIVTKNMISKTATIMDIDEIPSFSCSP